MSATPAATVTETRKRKSLVPPKSKKQAKKVEKHVLDNPFKIRWPVHSPETTNSTLGNINTEICARYSEACTADPTISDERGKRNFGHKLEKDRKLVFSVNCVTKLLEQNFSFKLVCVEEGLISSRIFDHLLHLCGARSVPLLKGAVSLHLATSLGRKRVAVVGVPGGGDVTAPGDDVILTAPVLPYVEQQGLPKLHVRIVDVSPSEQAIERLRKKKERNAKRKALSGRMEVD